MQQLRWNANNLTQQNINYSNCKCCTEDRKWHYKGVINKLKFTILDNNN